MSLKLTLEGTREGLDELLAKYLSGELERELNAGLAEHGINGLTVESITGKIDDGTVVTVSKDGKNG